VVINVLQIQRSHIVESSPVAGMVPVSSSSGDGKEGDCYEVWVHEECAVWAAGVHVVGSRIVGLREAVWSAVHTVSIIVKVPYHLIITYTLIF
jgi:hypothetical protein